MKLFNCLVKAFLRKWYSTNFSMCKAEAYLAIQRHEILTAVWWSNQAHDWQEKWRAAQ